MPKKPELSEEDQATRERLGVALRQASSARGVRPQDMAAAGGVSLAHQYRVEAGETTPDALYLFKVCRFLGIAIDSLFNATVAVEQGAAPSAARPSSVRIGNMNNNTPGGVQVGYAAGKVSVKRR